MLSAIVWLGAGLYDIFILWEIRRAERRPHELTLIQLHLRYGPVIAGSVLLVLISGLLMSSLLGWGYFRLLWLGAKQALMVLVLVLMVPFIPLMVRLQRAADNLSGDAAVSDEVRALVTRAARYELAMRAAALVAVIMAIWRPQ